MASHRPKSIRLVVEKLSDEFEARVGTHQNHEKVRGNLGIVVRQQNESSLSPGVIPSDLIGSCPERQVVSIRLDETFFLNPIVTFIVQML